MWGTKKSDSINFLLYLIIHDKYMKNRLDQWFFDIDDFHRKYIIILKNPVI